MSTITLSDYLKVVGGEINVIIQEFLQEFVHVNSHFVFGGDYI